MNNCCAEIGKKIVVNKYPVEKRKNTSPEKIEIVMIGDVLDWDTGFQVLRLISYIMGLRQSKVSK